MGTRCRAKIIMDGKCVRELYRSMDGYPSCAARDILGSIFPLTPAPATVVMATIERLVKVGVFDNPPSFITEDNCEYNYELVINDSNMKFTYKYYDEEEVLLYEEEYLEHNGKVWKRPLSYSEDSFY